MSRGVSSVWIASVLAAVNALAAGGGALAGGGGELSNGDFEARLPTAVPGAGVEPAIPGWSALIGAHSGGVEPHSAVALDREHAHGGRASLHFSGEESTRAWWLLSQDVPARPGGEYALSAWTRAAGVRASGSGMDNCYVGLLFFDADGVVVGREFRFPNLPDSDWKEQKIELVAPPTARRASVYLFLSMIGDFWVDDVALEIRGGEKLPEPLRVWSEDFRRLKRLTSAWKTEVGAINGSGGTSSLLAIDPDVGAPDSPGSLRLSGDGATTQWQLVARYDSAQAGERFTLRGTVKTEDVRREGSQSANLHLNLAFFGKKGEGLGVLRFASLEPGTRDWTELQVDAVAPEGVAKVRAGFFLSMSGTAWVDELELTRLAGIEPPYRGWKTVETETIVLRFSPDHPQAASMADYAALLEKGRAHVCRELEVDFAEQITVFVYTSVDQGRALTGAQLDFADPQSRSVHQRMESTVAHELTHVIAHTVLGNALTGILGEGTAVWLDGRPFDAHHARAAELLAKGELPSVQALLADFRAEPQGYPAAGSFCGWLLETHGLAVFKQIYALGDPSTRAKELVGKSFVEMEADWHAALAKYR